MSLGSPAAPLIGLIVVVGAAALVSLVIAGHVVGVAIAGAVIAYGIFIWQSRRLRRFEESVEGKRDE